MKNEMCLALIMLATLPASAQTKVNQNCSASGDVATALTRDYAAHVDGLLREAHASLQSISERMEAGQLTSEQARELKLAATRDVISRLDTISAVYDTRLELKDKVNPEVIPAACTVSSANEAVRATPGGNSTVSVEELRREQGR